MADADNEDQEAPILLFEDNPVATDPQSVKILAPLESLDVVLESLGIMGQDRQLLFDDPLVGLFDPFEIVKRPAEELELIHRQMPRVFQTFSASRILSRPFSRSSIRFRASFRSIRSK